MREGGPQAMGGGAGLIRKAGSTPPSLAATDAPSLYAAELDWFSWGGGWRCRNLRRGSGGLPGCGIPRGHAWG